MPPRRTDRGPTSSDPSAQSDQMPAGSGVIAQSTAEKWQEQTLVEEEGLDRGLPEAVHALSPDYPAIAQYGRYEILGRLAVGGMAEVFLAREMGKHSALRHIAIKRILPQIADDDTFVEMFLDEARLAIQLNHPNICHIYDFGEEDDSYFIAMEWVNGVPFGRLIRRAREFGMIPVAVAVKVIGHVAEALHHAHQARDGMGRPMNIVHRDVSPQNIMVRFDGVVKLLDFGIAKNAAQTSQTEAGVVKGKFSYMAPEQCLGRPLDARTDIFALGSCLYESLTGRAAFRRGSDLDTMRAIVHEEPSPITAVRPDVSDALLRIVDMAMAKDPKDRFQTAGDMYVALERFLAVEGEFVRSMHIAQYVETLMPGEAAAGPLAYLNRKDVATEQPSASVSGTTDELVSHFLEGPNTAAPDPSSSDSLLGGLKATHRPPGKGIGTQPTARRDRPSVATESHSSLPKLAAIPSLPPKPAIELNPDAPKTDPNAFAFSAGQVDDGPTEQMDKAAIAAALAELDSRRRLEDGFGGVAPAPKSTPGPERSGAASEDDARPSSTESLDEILDRARRAAPSRSRRNETERVMTSIPKRRRRGSRVLVGSLLVAVIVLGVGLGFWYARSPALSTSFRGPAGSESRTPESAPSQPTTDEGRSPDPAEPSAPENQPESSEPPSPALEALAEGASGAPDSEGTGEEGSADEAAARESEVPRLEEEPAEQAEAAEAAPAEQAEEAVAQEAVAQEAVAADDSTAEAASEDTSDSADASELETGRITVVTTPRSVAYIDGQRLGTTPIRRHTLPAGEHRLLLRDRRGRRYERTIEISAGRTRELFYRLTR